MAKTKFVDKIKLGTKIECVEGVCWICGGLL